MKKLLVSLLILALSASTLVGCGGSYNSGGGNPSTAIDFQASLGGSTNDKSEESKNDADKSGAQSLEITASIELTEVDKYNRLGLLVEEGRKEYAEKLLAAIFAVGDGKAWGEYYGVTKVAEEEKSAQYGNYGTAFYSVLVEDEEGVDYAQEEYSADKSECYYRRFYAEDAAKVVKLIYVLHYGENKDYYMIAVNGVAENGNKVMSTYEYNREGVPTSAWVREVDANNKIIDSEQFSWK